jgi:protocatechuate 3,4-dioxygenase beta subunit
MKKNKKDSRRQFLKNASLSVFSAATLPIILQSAPPPASLNIKKSMISCNESTEDAYGQGPFYIVNAPSIQNNQLADISEVGTRIIISGQVYNLECSEVIPNTEIDIWHANESGEYDDTGYNLRGKTTTNSQGFYIFESVKPGLYLNGSTFRPSHIHFKITPPGFDTLITQLYFQGDPYIATDVAASMTSGVFDATNRIIPLILNSNGELEGTWDIIIDGNGLSVGTNHIHLDKGIIYSANPNPFIDTIEINYGVFQKAKVGISVYDIRGQIVANLDEKILKPERYSVSWEPNSNLPKGYYFISIKINDLQVHYLKVIRK